MSRPLRLVQAIGQGIAYAAFAALIGYFSVWPAYTHLDPGLGLIKLSFSHSGDPKTECRRLTQQELDQLPPNMRRPTECPRERVPLLVELTVDGKAIYRDLLPPSGIAGDGESTAYKRFPIAPGRHRLLVRMRDSRRTSGFDWEHESVIEIAPRQNFVVDFQPETGGFRFLQ